MEDYYNDGVSYVFEVGMYVYGLQGVLNGYMDLIRRKGMSVDEFKFVSDCSDCIIVQFICSKNG